VQSLQHVIHPDIQVATYSNSQVPFVHPSWLASKNTFLSILHVVEHVCAIPLHIWNRRNPAM